MNSSSDRLSSAQQIVAHLDADFENPTRNYEIEKRLFAPHGIHFCVASDEALEAISDRAAVICFVAKKVTDAVLARFPRCRLAIRYGIGLDNIDIPAATARGIAVCNIPDFCLDEMADHTLALTLYLARQLSLYARSTSPSAMLPVEPIPGFSGQRFTTIGFGRIARKVLDRARAFGFQLAAFDPFVSADTIRATGIEALTFEEALTTSDILSLHCPLTEKTRHLMRAETFQKMRPDALLINTARGGLIHTDDLVEALQNNRIRGAGLDVSDPEPLPSNHPLFNHPRVIITPHIGWYSEQSKKTLRTHLAEEIIRFFQKEPLHYQVNKNPSV